MMGCAIGIPRFGTREVMGGETRPPGVVRGDARSPPNPPEVAGVYKSQFLVHQRNMTSGVGQVCQRRSAKQAVQGVVTTCESDVQS
jgi:hypothetical protein